MIFWWNVLSIPNLFVFCVIFLEFDLNTPPVEVILMASYTLLGIPCWFSVQWFCLATLISFRVTGECSLPNLIFLKLSIGLFLKQLLSNITVNMWWMPFRGLYYMLIILLQVMDITIFVFSYFFGRHLAKNLYSLVYVCLYLWLSVCSSAGLFVSLSDCVFQILCPTMIQSLSVCQAVSLKSFSQWWYIIVFIYVSSVLFDWYSIDVKTLFKWNVELYDICLMCHIDLSYLQRNPICYKYLS